MLSFFKNALNTAAQTVGGGGSSSSGAKDDSSSTAAATAATAATAGTRSSDSSAPSSGATGATSTAATVAAATGVTSMSNYINSGAPELREMRREWGAIRRFFDAAIDESCAQAELSSQLPDLDTKLRYIVALIHCGGRLPSGAAAAATESGDPQAYSWERFPGSKSPIAFDACRQEGFQIFGMACQHAKSNLPAGSRAVLAGFMLEFIAMCESHVGELSSSKSSSADAAGAGGSDEEGEYRKDRVGWLLVEQRHAVCLPLVNFVSKSHTEVIRCRQYTGNIREEPLEKLHFARLVRYLCEAVAFQPHRLLPRDPALLQPPSSTQQQQQQQHEQDDDDDGAAAAAAAAAAQQLHIRALADSGQVTLPWLLDLVAEFSRADDLYPVSAQGALDAVLRGHLALALGPFELVEARAGALTDSLLAQLGFTFVTLCRLEENSEFADHVAVCAVTVRYLDALAVFAPHVVDAAEVHLRFFKFLTSTVVEMVKLPADRCFVVSMLLLSAMIDACTTGSALPALIAQAVVAHSQPVTEAFFSRLTDISTSVKSAAASFLLNCICASPMLFVSLISAGSPSAIEQKHAEGDPPVASDNVAELFPIAISDAVASFARTSGRRLADDARRRVILSESRRTESAPSAATLGEPFVARATYFVRQLRRALAYDLQQFTTHGAAHCSLLSGIVVELLALPPSSPDSVRALLLRQDTSSTNASANANGIVVTSIASVSNHVETRMGRLEPETRAQLQDILRTCDSPDAALLQIQKRMPDNLKSFAHGAVHLAVFQQELAAVLVAREQQEALFKLGDEAVVETNRNNT